MLKYSKILEKWRKILIFLRNFWYNDGKEEAIGNYRINKYWWMSCKHTRWRTQLHSSIHDTLHMVSKPTVVSTNWFLRSPLRVTGTPTTCSKDVSSYLHYLWKIQELNKINTSDFHPTFVGHFNSANVSASWAASVLDVTPSKSKERCYEPVSL